RRLIEPGSLVPWMAYSPPPLSVSAAAPMGLLGLAPAITSGSEGLSCLTSAGGDHAGRSCLLVMKAVGHRVMAHRVDSLRGEVDISRQAGIHQSDANGTQRRDRIFRSDGRVAKDARRAQQIVVRLMPEAIDASRSTRAAWGVRSWPSVVTRRPLYGALDGANVTTQSPPAASRLGRNRCGCAVPRATRILPA